MHKLNWGDLLYILAVAKEGSAAAAARALNVNHATVIRHVKAFETAQGLRIFDHLASGYRLTPEGEVFLDAARAIDATVTELERKIVGDQGRLAGKVRLTTTDGLFPLLLEDVGEFRRCHPQVTLELLVTNLHLNLDTLDADVAIRPTLQPPLNLVGRRICELALAVYGTSELQREYGSELSALNNAPWLGLSGQLATSAPGQWLNEQVADERVTIRCDSFISLLGLAEQGLGFAVLPCFLGDASAALGRVSPEPLSARPQIWVLSHRDLLRSPRVSACVKFFQKTLQAKRARLEGRIAFSDDTA